MELLASIELQQLQGALDLALEEASRSALTAAFEELRSRVAEQFLTQGPAYGSRWANRQPPTGSRPLLVLTGRLLSSLVNRDDPEHIEQILAGPGSTLVGIFRTGVPYANPLHFGTRHMPGRPLLTERMLSL